MLALPHRDLIWQLTRRDIAARYRGTALGLLWSLITPLLMLAMYTFVFSVVFQARWPQTETASKGEFALLLFTGLIIHGLATECLIKSPALVTGNPNYVKKVVFPLPVLPVVTLLTALFHFTLSFAVLLAAQIYFTGTVPITALWMPVILLPFAIGLLGCMWALAALGVYLRDIGQIVGLGLTILLFLSPIFYPATALPEAWRPFLYANPLTLIIEQSRAVILLGQSPDFFALALYTAAACVMLGLGYALFKKLRGGFADVL
jgi:lipopolysaccharide transport system permease protein